MIAFFLTVLVVALLGYLTIWVLGKLAPSHPSIIDNLIWVVVVVFIALMLLRAVGFADIPMPRLG